MNYTFSFMLNGSFHIEMWAIGKFTSAANNIGDRIKCEKWTKRKKKKLSLSESRF